jgi:hypothetical protein
VGQNLLALPVFLRYDGREGLAHKQKEKATQLDASQATG